VSDDGSTDRTTEIASSMDIPNLKVISTKRNYGRGNALKRAIACCRSDYVVYIDADLSINPKAIHDIISNLHTNPIVIGSKHLSGSRIKYQPLRLFLSKGYRNLANFLFGLRVSDYQAGIKGFRTEVIRGLDIKANGWSWDTEVIVKAKRKHLPVKEIPITVNEVNKSSSVKVLRDSWRMLINLLRLRLE
jgi:glycosyltransferase involved in cell wall biosynthesis